MLVLVVSLSGGDGCRPGQRKTQTMEQILEDQDLRENRERKTNRSQEKEESREGHSLTWRSNLIRFVTFIQKNLL